MEPFFVSRKGVVLNHLLDWWPVIVCLAGFATTLLLTPLVRRVALRYNFLDRATQFHSGHTVAVPRLGGVVLAVAFGVILLAIATYHKFAISIPEGAGVIVAGSLAMFALGFWDDLRSLGAKTKLAAQILIATLVYMGGLQIGHWENPFTHTLYDLSLLDGPLTVLWLISVTNLINLVDGVDGLAAGLALMLMILLALLSGSRDGVFTMLLAVGMAGALLGFLLYNFPPARIFMGDGGAYFLGFMIAALSLYNFHKGTVAMALMAPFLALGLPIIDASFTLLRRGLTGLPIFRADRGHIHHRLSAMGFSQLRVVWLLYAVCAFFSMLALGVYISEGRLIPVLFGVFVFGAVLSARLFGFVQDWYKVGRLLTTAIQRRKATRYALLLGHWLEMEAERAGSLEELWTDFTFMAQKLGFGEVKVQTDGGVNHWHSPKAMSISGKKHSVRLEVSVAGPVVLEFCAEASAFDTETFRLLSELAAESWIKSVKQWAICNASPAG